MGRMNADDLLRRGDVQKAVYKLGQSVGDDYLDIGELVSEIDHVEKAPNVVCPVRCVECKHWDKYRMKGEYPKHIWCRCGKFSTGIFENYSKPDDYCCWGERMEEDSE